MTQWPATPPEIDERKWVRFLLGDRRVRGIVAPPLPEAAIQAQFVGSCGAEAFVEASVFCAKLRAVARTHADAVQPDSRILDFGVGWGRLYRVMLNHVKPTTLVGADIDQMCVDLCSSAMSYGTFVRNGISPPLDFASHTLDLIYAYSVFSHLAPEVAGDWMKEFRRVLRPGGLVAFTTLKPAHLAVWRDQSDGADPNYVRCLQRVAFDHDRWAARAAGGEALYLPIGGGDLREDSFYGETVFSMPAVHALAVTAGLEVLVFEDGSDLPQSFVVLRRPDTSARESL
jgi:SAM-dependent methyltransferase